MHTGTDDEVQSCFCPTDMFQNASQTPVDYCVFRTEFHQNSGTYRYKFLDCGKRTCKWSEAYVPPK
ncbi:hypothetical protein C8R48DRAFT_100225 [Suillus tomentosus]|nr:hypothetical protein C8R48DRAFT_100225 [Suillus tomentosus]